MNWLRRMVFVLAVAGTGGLSVNVPVAVAQDDAKAKRAARKLLSTGDRALKRGDRHTRRKKADAAQAEYQAALDAYKKAYEVLPKPQIYFAIGNAEEKLGLYLDAYGHYRRLLEEAEDIGDQLRAAVEMRIDSAAQHLTIVTLTAEPEGAKVFLDERELGISPLSEPLVLEPGPHKITVRKDEYKAGVDEFHAEPGAKIEKTIALEPLPKIEDVAPPPAPTKPKALPPPPGRTVVLASLITTGTLAVAASVAGVLALTKHGTFSDGSLGATERRDAGDSGKVMALTTDILIGATVLAAGYTAYYYYGIYRPRAEVYYRESAEAQQALHLMPYAGPTGGGVALGGRF